MSATWWNLLHCLKTLCNTNSIWYLSLININFTWLTRRSIIDRCLIMPIPKLVPVVLQTHWHWSWSWKSSSGFSVNAIKQEVLRPMKWFLRCGKTPNDDCLLWWHQYSMYVDKSAVSVTERSNEKARWKQHEAAVLIGPTGGGRPHQHVLSLFETSLDKHLLCLHISPIAHYPDFVPVIWKEVLANWVHTSSLTRWCREDFRIAMNVTQWCVFNGAPWPILDSACYTWFIHCLCQHVGFVDNKKIQIIARLIL